MSQISPPLRILLVGSIVFLAAWMVVLRPGGDTATPPAANPAAPAASNPNGAPANTSLGRAVQKANGAAAASDAATAAVTGETSAPATSGSAPATSGSAPATAAAAGTVTDVPAWVQQDLGKKVMVLLFWNPKAADDKATRRELRHVADPRFHGKQVVVKAIPISQVSQYAGLTRDAKIEQSPTTVVVDRDRQVETLVGYADRQAISQAVSDALRADKK